MDPLSVAASVAGLIQLTSKLVPALYNLGLAITEANKDAQAAATEVAGMSVVLQGLQTYILGRLHANPERLRLITVEQITASLTACVLTYSELDETLQALHADSGLKVWERAVWSIKRDSIQKLVTSIQNHKMTFACMLNILQCDSAQEAERSMDRVCERVELLLSENRALSARLRNLEHLLASGSPRRTNRSSLDSSSSAKSHVYVGVLTQPHAAAHMDPSTTQPHNYGPLRASAFEEQLNWSRVYRRAQANHSESSLTVDGRSALALSMSSSLTLDEVSKISVFALPIFADELSNSEAYTFAWPVDDTTHIATSQVMSHEKSRSLTASAPAKVRPVRTKFDEMDLELEDMPRLATFDVPLDVSKQHAEVAITLTNDEGQQSVFGYVPLAVGLICVFLKEMATDIENVFATGWSPQGVQALEAALNTVECSWGRLDWTAYTVYDAANVLLRYLLHLPEPVIPSAFYNLFRKPLEDYKARTLAFIGSHDRQSPQDSALDIAIHAYQTLIAELPAPNRHLLLYLLDLLAVFAANSEINKMTIPRLAAVFEPTILSYDQHSFSATEKQLSQDILSFLIEHQDRFLDGMMPAGWDYHDDVASTLSDSLNDEKAVEGGRL